MNDTHPKTAELFLKLLKTKSNEERLIMGGSMRETAKQIIRDSIIAKYPGISNEELNKRIFQRFYGYNISERFSKMNSEK